MDASFAITSFVGGELCQYVQGNFTEPVYKIGLNLCSNAIPVEEGAWVRRPGTQFAGLTRRGAQGRVIGFDVVASAPYDIELTPGFMRIWQGQSLALAEAAVTVTSISTDSPAILVPATARTWNTGDTVQIFLAAPGTNYLAAAYLQNRQFVVTKTDTTHFTLKDQLGNNLDGSKFALGSTAATVAKVLELPTQWPDATTIGNVRIAQSEGQVLMFAYQVQTQLLTVDTTQTPAFTLAAAPFQDGPYLDPPKDNSSVQASATSGTVTLTFSADQGLTEANEGQFVRLLSEPPPWVSGTSYSPGDKTTYNGVYYNCIVATGTTNPPDTTPASQAICPSAAQWCYATILEVASGTSTTATLFNIPQPPPPNIVIPPVGPLLYTHDSSNPIKTYRMGLYWGTKWPQNGTFHEGRFWFAGAVNNRADSAMANNGFVCSPTFYDGTPADDCGVSAVFNFPEVMQINAMIPNHIGIVCLCQSGEVLIQSSQLSDPITPTSIQAHQTTRYGSEKIEPLAVGYSTLFVNRYGKKLFDLAPNFFNSQRISAINVSLTGRHLTQPGLLEIRAQRELAPLIWARSPNGIGNWIGMSYKREDGYGAAGPIFNGWHRHVHGSGNRYPTSIATGTVQGGATDTLAMLTTGTNPALFDYNTGHVEFLTGIFQEGQSSLCAWQADDAIVPVSANVVYAGGLPASAVFYGLWHVIGRTVSAYIGGLDCGDYVVASDGSITVPFAPAAQPLFTFAYLQSVTSTCNAVTFIGGAAYSAPSFLANPSVQSYVDAPGGSQHAEWSGGFGPGTTNVFGTGPANSQQFLSQFNFSTGALISQQDVNALGITPQFQSSITLGGDGKLWLYGPPDKNVGTHCNFELDPSTWTVAASWGAVAGFPLGFFVPLGTPPISNAVYLAIGTTHWLVQAGFALAGAEGTDIAVLRADPPSFGFWGHIFSAGTGGGGGSTVVCAGPQSVSSATAYWTNTPFSIFGSGFNFGKTVISAGADSYSPATWPTANTHITSTNIKTYVGTDFDASWSAISFLSGPAYDATDGNVIVQVSGTGGGNANYIAKLSTTDGSVVWKLAIGNATGFDGTAPTLSRIQAGTYYFWEHTSTWGGTCHAVKTADGTDSTQAFSGLAAIGSQVSDDQLGCIMGNITWNTADGTLTLLNATATSGSTMGTVYFAQGQQPQAAVVATAPGVIGFRFSSKGQLLRQQSPETSGARNGPAMGKTRRTHRASAYFVNAISGDVSFGTDFVTMYPQNLSVNGESRTVLQPFTGISRLELSDDYSFDSMIAWETHSLYPLAIAAVEGFLDTSDL